MLSGAARRLVSLYGVLPGTRAVVVTTSDRGVRAAIALAAAGLQIAALADLRPGSLARLPAPARQRRRAAAGLDDPGCARTPGGAQCRAHPGRGDPSGAPPSQRREFECDLVIVSGGDAPSASLIDAAGGRTAYNPERGNFRVAALPDGCARRRAAGGRGRLGRGGGVRRAGRAGGGERARLRATRPPAPGGRGCAGGSMPTTGPSARFPRPTPEADDPARSLVCFCSDVSVKDMHRCVEDGHRSLELCKQHTSVTAGPCDARMCGLAALRLMAKATGQSLDQASGRSAPVACHQPGTGPEDLGRITAGGCAPAPRQSKLHCR